MLCDTEKTWIYRLVEKLLPTIHVWFLHGKSTPFRSFKVDLGASSNMTTVAGKEVRDSRLTQELILTHDETKTSKIYEGKLFCRKVLKDSIYKQVTSKNLDLEVPRRSRWLTFFWCLLNQIIAGSLVEKVRFLVKRIELLWSFFGEGSESTSNPRWSHQWWKNTEQAYLRLVNDVTKSSSFISRSPKKKYDDLNRKAIFQAHHATKTNSSPKPCESLTVERKTTC